MTANRLAARRPGDDFGTGLVDGKGFFLANLSNLLCTRYDAARKTIITTNLILAPVKAQFLSHDGGRLLDRLHEGGVFHWSDGPSLRAK